MGRFFIFCSSQRESVSLKLREGVAQKAAQQVTKTYILSWPKQLYLTFTHSYNTIYLSKPIERMTIMCTNKHYYCMFNGITVTTSDVIIEGYKEYICVRFERPNANNGFDFAEIIMPDRNIIKSYGFSEDELFWIESLAVDNLLLMWEMSKEAAKIA